MQLVDTSTGEIVTDAPHLTLAEHEAIIERHLNGFIEAANAFLAIKADKKYREAGYSSFEDYCERRWNISRRHGHRLAVAAATAEMLARDLPEMGPMGHIPEPQSERQIRPLASLPESARAAAYLDAIDAADGQPPTATQVEQAVAARLGTTIEDLVEAGATVTVKPNTRPWSQSELPSMPAPDPPEPVSEVDEHSKSIDRRVKRLQMFCSSLHEFRKLATCVDRDEVLARLAPSDLDIVLRAEKEITWTT